MITLRPMQADQTVAETLSRWYNDANTRHLIFPNKKEEAMPEVTPEAILNELQHSTGVWRFMIMQDEGMIGSVDLSQKEDLFLKEPLSTLWMGITLAPEHRGKGHGEQVLALIEKEAAQRHYARLEFGTFSNNLRARKLYKKAGYTEFGRIESFTWHEGQWFDDLRFEKYLPKDNGIYLADVITALVYLLQCLKHPDAWVIKDALKRFRNEEDLNPYLSYTKLDSSSLSAYLPKEKQSILGPIFTLLRHLSYELVKLYRMGVPMDLEKLNAPPVLLSALEKGQLLRFIDDMMKI